MRSSTAAGPRNLRGSVSIKATSGAAKYEKAASRPFSLAMAQKASSMAATSAFSFSLSGSAFAKAMADKAANNMQAAVRLIMADGGGSKDGWGGVRGEESGEKSRGAGPARG